MLLQTTVLLQFQVVVPKNKGAVLNPPTSPPTHPPTHVPIYSHGAIIFCLAEPEQGAPSGLGLGGNANGSV